MNFNLIRFILIVILFIQVFEIDARRKHRHRHKLRRTTTTTTESSDSDSSDLTQESDESDEVKVPSSQFKGGRAIVGPKGKPAPVQKSAPKPTLPVKSTEKPKRTKSIRVVGGRPAAKYFYKSIVALRILKKTSCGIVAGEYQLTKLDGTEQEVKAFKVIKHENYDTDQNNDIALIQLEKPIKFTDKIQPVVLPTKDFKPTGSLTIVGWGALTHKNKTVTDILQTVDLPVITNEECQKLYYDHTINPSHICTLVRGGGQDACQGDSGGPLYSIGKNGVQTLAGIVSWGIQCAQPDNPGVYTRVAHYLDWINKQIKANPPAPQVPKKKKSAAPIPPPGHSAFWKQPLTYANRFDNVFGG